MIEAPKFYKINIVLSLEEPYLGTCQISMRELLCENKLLKAADYFREDVVLISLWNLWSSTCPISILRQ